MLVFMCALASQCGPCLSVISSEHPSLAILDQTAFEPGNFNLRRRLGSDSDNSTKDRNSTKGNTSASVTDTSRLDDYVSDSKGTNANVNPNVLGLFRDMSLKVGPDNQWFVF